MQSSVLNSNDQFSKHEFDLLASSKSRFVSVKLAEISDATRLYEFIGDYLNLQENVISLIEDLILRNKKGVFLFEKNGVVLGFYALQMLNEHGLEALLSGNFDGSYPVEKFLTQDGQSSSALYVWSYIAPGLAANGVRYVSRFLQRAEYRNVNFYARPVTAEGLQVTLDFGFVPVESSTDGLYCYTRLINRSLSHQQAA